MLKVVNLDNPDERKEYEIIIRTIDKQDPYLLYDYINIFNNRKKNLICFIYSSNSTILLPGYLNEISLFKEAKYYDFITPYGYSGPYYSEKTTDIELERFWAMINEWYQQNNVVSEFIRFNLYGNERMYNGEITPTLLNVKGKILDETNQWNYFEHKVRKNIKKAQRENLSCKICHQTDVTDEEIKKFYSIYIATMKRTNAEKQFFYPVEDFITFIHNNPENSTICNVYCKDQVISSELLLVSRDSIFSFLGGTNDQYFDKRPNDFLKFMMINWARETGKKYYVLGGGYGNEDGIFKYKKSFFPQDLVRYNTGRKIVNSDIYFKLFELNNEQRLKNGLPKLNIDDKSFFPIYNKKN